MAWHCEAACVAVAQITRVVHGAGITHSGGRLGASGTGPTAPSERPQDNRDREPCRTLLLWHTRGCWH